jgi:hypothetical protein
MDARFPLVEEMTDRVLGWFGFTTAADYRMVPLAMEVAIEAHRLGFTPDTLTREGIETADSNTGARMAAMWGAAHNTTYAKERSA